VLRPSSKLDTAQVMTGELECFAIAQSDMWHLVHPLSVWWTFGPALHHTTTLGLHLAQHPIASKLMRWHKWSTCSRFIVTYQLGVHHFAISSQHPYYTWNKCFWVFFTEQLINYAVWRHSRLSLTAKLRLCTSLVQKTWLQQVIADQDCDIDVIWSQAHGHRSTWRSLRPSHGSSEWVSE